MKGGVKRALPYQRRRRANRWNCRGPPIWRTAEPPEERAGPPKDRVFKTGSFGGAFNDTAGAATGGAGTAQKPGGTSDTSGALAFAVGDVVQFTGNTHYTSAAAASGKACKPGPAKVTMISKGAKHPYHLIKQAGGGSTVYGWVNAADVQSETDAAIDKLAGLGVINSPDYWKNAVAGGKVAYLDILFTQAAAKITKAGPRTADVKSGVGALVKAGVINTPEYWLQNYGKLQSLDLLLCALGGAV